MGKTGTGAEGVVKEKREERLLVKKVKGEKEVYVGQKVKFEVTEYNKNKSEVTDNDKKNIKWAVKVDDKLRFLFERGEIIELKIRKEWEEKELTLMPHLISPKKDVAVKTKVIKFPILIAQSDRQPGKNRDGTVARDMYCGDMTKVEILGKFWDGIVKNSAMYAAKALTFENANAHFSGFKSMATTLFAQNDIKLFQPVFPEDLDQDCFIQKGIPTYDERTKRTVLERTYSIVHLENNIISMIDHFRNGDGKNYSNYNLTTAVLCHESTIRFFNDIRKELAKELNDKKGNLIEIKGKKLNPIRRPAYNTWTDKFQGLTIALNDTWAYEVWITEYQLEDDRSYKGKMKIIIYDHFGLDDDDVNLNKPARHIDGFYHWFALQRWEGFNKKYKPFITVIEKELPFKGKI